MPNDRAYASPPYEPVPFPAHFDVTQTTDIASAMGKSVGLFKDDASDPWRREETLQVTSLQLSAVVECVSDLVIIVDEDCAICYVNPAVTAILGYDPAELLGTNWLNLVHPEDVMATHVGMRHCELANVDTPIECRAKHRDGMWRYLETRTASLPSSAHLPRTSIIARDVTDTKLMQERQTRLLLEATINGQEEERERICLDIHDGVCQTLATAFQYLEMVELDSSQNLVQMQRLRTAQELVRQGMRQAREIVASLRSARLDALGLVAALRHDVRDLAERTGIKATFEADALRLPGSVETALYRVIHEALNNIIKHAHATHVAATLRQHRDELEIVVQDNGVGFPVERGLLGSDGRGIGLISMRRRTELLQGKFEVSSTLGNGSSICITVPLHGPTTVG
ncbi:MAG: histidine kinase [Chloroflexi bacterium]|nr:histidine kinase [Chloroflexota bacterium]